MPDLDETYVMCNECGAKLYSTMGSVSYLGKNCPFKRDEHGKCVTPEERPDLYCNVINKCY